MKRFSIGESIGDGFRLIGRRPLAVLVWGLLILAPAIGAMALLFPAFGEMMTSMPVNGSAEEAEAAMSEVFVGQMIQMQAAAMLMNLCQLLAMAVVYTAIMRAVLRPNETRFFSLRIGMDELRVAVAGLAIMIGLYAAILALGLGGMAAGLILWSVNQSLAPFLIGIMAFALAVGLFWGLARVSLIAPASVLHRDFAFGDGWNLARGKAWPLLGMMALICLIVLAIELLVVIGMGLFIGVLGADGLWIELADPFAAMAWAAANWYWLAPAGLFAALIYGLVVTLCVAPFASACRQLADGARPIPEPGADTAADPAGSVA